MRRGTDQGAGRTTASRARQLLHLVRVRGARRTVRAVVQGYVFSFRRWYICYRTIRPAAAPAPPSEFECRLATVADIESFAVFEPNRHRREFREWLENGAFLFAAFADGRPVAFQCISKTVPTGPPLSSLTLGPGQLWAVDVQTLPEFQRHRVAVAIRAYRDRVLTELGYRQIVSSVQDNNYPALVYAYGGRQRLVDRVELLSWLCVLGFSRIRVEPDALAKLENHLTKAGLLPGARP
jgi:hypothetical protein